MYLKKFVFFLFFFISLIFSDNLEVKPIIFTLHSSNGSDWVYDKTPLTSFGAGLSFEYQNPNWSVLVDYIQLGFIGQINHSLYSFSSIKSLPYLDKSKGVHNGVMPIFLQKSKHLNISLSDKLYFFNKFITYSVERSFEDSVSPYRQDKSLI